jgi:hypothetical protein
MTQLRHLRRTCNTTCDGGGKRRERDAVATTCDSIFLLGVSRVVPTTAKNPKMAAERPNCDGPATRNTARDGGQLANLAARGITFPARVRPLLENRSWHDVA